MELTKRLARVKRKAAEQGKKLGAPLSLEQVELFEREAKLKLPEDYRAFLLEVGNGGDGPPTQGGLLPLGDLPSDLGRSRDEVIARASEPFPLREGRSWEDGDSDDDAVDDIGPAQVHQGVLHLGDDGCGAYWVLVVTGKARGKIWQLACEGAWPCQPARSFLSWYEDWLDGERHFRNELYSVPRPPRYDSRENRRLALGLAEEILSREPNLAFEIAARVEIDQDLRARAAFVRAYAAAKLKDERALSFARELVREWLEPPTIGSVNQVVVRQELVALLEALPDGDPATKAAMKQSVLLAPEPDTVVPDGDTF